MLQQQRDSNSISKGNAHTAGGNVVPAVREHGGLEAAHDFLDELLRRLLVDVPLAGVGREGVVEGVLVDGPALTLQMPIAARRRVLGDSHQAVTRDGHALALAFALLPRTDGAYTNSDQHGAVTQADS